MMASVRAWPDLIRRLPRSPLFSIICIRSYLQALALKRGYSTIQEQHYYVQVGHYEKSQKSR